MVRFTFLTNLVFLSAATALSSPGEAVADPALIERGHAIAENYCARCHAIGKTGISPNAKSPPFRTISRKYPLSNLEEALSEGIMVGHEGSEMPEFRLDPPQIEALLAYMGSVQEK
jgi:mono/diheme cytochrome c family protein